MFGILRQAIDSTILDLGTIVELDLHFVSVCSYEADSPLSYAS